MRLNAEDFVNRTGFIPESDEERLNDGVPIQYEAAVFATQHMSAPLEYFVGVALMRESDQGAIANLIDFSGDEPTIETNDLQESGIPTTLVNNGEDLDGNRIENVSHDQFARLSPGKRVKVEVRLTTDDDGQEYLNGSIVEVLDVESNALDMELEDFATHKQGAEAPEA